MACVAFNVLLAKPLPAQPLEPNKTQALDAIILRGGKVNPQSHWGFVRAISADGKRIAAMTEDAITVWDIASNQQIAKFWAGNQVHFATDKKIHRIFLFEREPKSNQQYFVCRNVADQSIVWKTAASDSTSISVSPDDFVLVFCDEYEHRIRIIEADTGLELIALKSPRVRSFSKAVFSPSGRYLLPVIENAEVEVWDLESGTASSTIQLPNRNTRLEQADFVNDDLILMYGREFRRPGWSHLLRLVSHSTGEVVYDFFENEESEGFEEFIISPLKQRLVLRFQSKFVVWDLETRQQIRQIDFEHYNPDFNIQRRSGMVVSADEKQIFANIGNSVCVWDLNTGEMLSDAEEKHNDSVNTIAVSEDGKWVATGGADGVVYLWDGLTGDLVRRVLDSSMEIHQVRFIPGRNKLAVVGDYFPEKRISAFLQLADLNTQALSKRYDLRSQKQSLAVTPDGSRILVSSATPNSSGDPFGGPGGPMYGNAARGSPKVLVFDSDKPAEPLSSLPAVRGFNRRIKISRDGQKVAMCTGSEVVVRDFAAHKALARFSPAKALSPIGTSPRQTITPMQGEFDFERNRVYVTTLRSSRIGNPPHVFAAIDVITSKIVWQREYPGAVPRAVLLTPDGKYLLTGLNFANSMHSQVLQVLEPDTGKLLFEYPLGDALISSACFSADSKRIYCGRSCGDFCVLDLEKLSERPGGDR